MLKDLFNDPEQSENVTTIGDSSSENGKPEESSPRPEGKSENSNLEDNPFRGRESSSEEDPSASPYLEFSKEVRNREDRLRREKLYLLFLSSVLALSLTVAVGVNLWVSSQSQVEPFYVAIDSKSGEVMRSGTVERMQGLTQPVIKNQIEKVIRGLREVYTDRRATRRAYTASWDRILPDSDAEDFVTSVLQLNTEEPKSPPSLIDDLQRTITELEITRVQNTRTYNVRWIERELREGKNQVRQRAFTGSFSTARIEKIEKQALQNNPLGLYVDGISWQQTSTSMVDEDLGEN